MKRKKLYLIFIVLIIFIIGIQNISYAIKCPSSEKLYLFTYELNDVSHDYELTLAKIKEKLKTDYGYTGAITQHIKVDTTITVKKVGRTFRQV